MKKSKWLPAGFWADFDTTFSRLFTGANLVALGFSGLYCAISWILERIYSSLFSGLLGVYSIIGNGSLKGELLQRWLPAGDAFFPNKRDQLLFAAVVWSPTPQVKEKSAREILEALFGLGMQGEGSSP